MGYCKNTFWRSQARFKEKKDISFSFHLILSMYMQYSVYAVELCPREFDLVRRFSYYVIVEVFSVLCFCHGSISMQLCMHKAKPKSWREALLGD
jgi:hypothetical protein